MIDVKELTYQVKHKVGRVVSTRVLEFLAKTCENMESALLVACLYDMEVKNNWDD